MEVFVFILAERIHRALLLSSLTVILYGHDMETCAVVRAE